LFQKIDAGASGLIVTMTMSPKPTGLPILHPRAQPVTRITRCAATACCCNTRHSPKFVLPVLETATKREVEDGTAGETAGKLKP
jgi:hypothetical protein